MKATRIGTRRLSAMLLASSALWSHQAQAQDQPGLSFFQGPGEPAPGPGAREPDDPELKRQMLGRGVVLAITSGRLDLGPAEQVYVSMSRGNEDH